MKTDWITTKYILDSDVLKVASADDTRLFSVHVRQLFDAAICFLTDIDKVSLFTWSDVCNGYVDFFNLVFLYSVKNLIPATDDFNAINISSPFVRVIIYDTNDFSVRLCCIVGKINITKNHSSC